MPVISKVMMTGAHGGYALMKVPLGGGATVFESLVREWKNHPEIQLELASPGPAYPELHPWLAEEIPGTDFRSIHPASLGYLAYARFCRAFERATTRMLLSKSPGSNGWVVTHDISEGPRVRALKGHGWKVMTLVHVDVVAFVTGIYLKNKILPQTLIRQWQWAREKGITRFLPDLVKLIFDKQEEAFCLSDAVVVPSAPMKKIIQECYPDTPARVEVVPWGQPSADPWETADEGQVRKWKSRWDIHEGDRVLLSLSRISPEKGIERTLEALKILEDQSPGLAGKLHFMVAGSAAYMAGPRYMKKLQGLAKSLGRVRVHFAGHLTGMDKACAFAAADLYCLMSHHESFGLTLSEAQAAGLSSVVSPAVGEKQPAGGGGLKVVNDSGDLAGFLKNWMEGREMLSKPSPPEPFSRAAGRLLEIMQA